MTPAKAAQVLREFQAWRRYGGPAIEAPDHPGPWEVGEAIDVAIEHLSSQEEKPGRRPAPTPEKEYYGG